MNQILGPMLILVGLVLLGWIGRSGGLVLAPLKLQSRAPAGQPLLTLARSTGSTWAAPLLFAIGTAGPVVLFSILIAFFAHAAGWAFEMIKKVELILRKLAGAVFTLVGIFYCLLYIYDLPLLDL